MTSLQFVDRQRNGDAGPIIDTIDGSGQDSVREAFKRGFMPLLWGSWDLVTIVVRLVDRGARATETTLATTALDIVRDDEATAEDIVAALNREDLDTVATDLDDHGYVVAAVTVNLPNIGLIRLAQNGQADIFNDAETQSVLAALSSAIYEQPAR